MIPMKLAQVADALGIDCDPRHRDLCVRRVTTDSREVQPGDLFFALSGPRYDGHQFITAARARGATACVCRRDSGLTDADFDTGSSPRLTVTDTVAALGRLAAYYRRTLIGHHTVVIAVTGSNGKTTTKCMIDHVLRPSLPGRAALRNFNNQIGVPLTLLSCDEADRYLIVEIGSSAPGEVKALAAMTMPDVAVITSIGEAHLEGFGTIEAVAAEKASLLDHLRPGGLAVVNIDRPEIRPYVTRATARLVTFGFDSGARLRVTKVDGSISHTIVELTGGYQLDLPMPGAHHANNAAATFAVARWMDITAEAIAAAFRSFIPPEGRARVSKLGGITMIDDTYNANPASVQGAVEALATVTSGRRVLVLGDMLELGDNAACFHEQAVEAVVDAGLEVFVAVGPLMGAAARTLYPPNAEFDWTELRSVGDSPAGPTEKTSIIVCDTAAAAADRLMALLTEGDTVWLKGSRAIRLDTVVAQLQARYGPATATAVAAGSGGRR